MKFTHKSAQDLDVLVLEKLPKPHSPKYSEDGLRRSRRSTLKHFKESDRVPERAKLPRRVFDGHPEIHPLTIHWWCTIWDEPMALEWRESDVQGLWVAAKLRNLFYLGIGDPLQLAQEMRKYEGGFGLSPMDRRRLDWRIEKDAPSSAPKLPKRIVEPESETFAESEEEDEAEIPSSKPSPRQARSSAIESRGKGDVRKLLAS